MVRSVRVHHGQKSWQQKLGAAGDIAFTVMNACVRLLASFLFSLRPKPQGMELPTVRVGLPTSVNLEVPSHTYLEAGLVGEFPRLQY